MGWIGMALLAPCCVSTLCSADEKPASYHFGKVSVDKVPAGWKAEKTGKGTGSIWKVVADATGPAKSGYVLAQTAASTGSVFNLCVAQGGKLKDVEIEVAFKAVKGERDQGGGPVWRYQDANNYYVARMNPLEDNYRLYKIVGGQRIQLATKEGITIPVGEWHALKVRHAGRKIECFLDGRKLLEAEDDAISGAGLVGLWTKADAQTHFDAFRAGAPKK